MDAALYELARKVSSAIPADAVIALGPENFDELRQPRVGVMWHFDDSSSDAGALGWFRSPEFKLSYNRAFTDDGRAHNLVARSTDRSSLHYAARHAGVCRTQSAPVLVRGCNQSFYGFAVTCGAADVTTEAQYRRIVLDTVATFRVHGWGPAEVAHRLVGHEEWAIFNERDNPTRRDLWGKLGRKIDPTGVRKDRRPVLSLVQGRIDVAALLAGERQASDVRVRW
jgi:hypothetical protein